MITLYESTETDFTHNGLGVLSDCSSAEVTKELNGKYELVLYYPVYDKKGMYLKLIGDRIIKAPTPDGDQLFRIVKPEKILSQVYVYCQHISYDLQHCFAANVNIVNQTRTGAIEYLLNNVVSKNDKFSVIGQTTAELHSTTIKRKYGLNAIISTDETTILDTWGGEYDFDNYNIIARDTIGQDKGVLIAYRKNLTGLAEASDFTDLSTRLVPIGKDDLMLPEVYIDSQYVNNYSQPYTNELSCPDATTVEELRTAVTKEYAKGVDIPSYNYKANFVSLAKTVEYKNYKVLETVNIGDTVHVKHPDWNLNLSARVIQYVYDSLLEKYKSIELGKYAKTFSSAIKALSAANKKNESNVTKSYNALVNAIAHATAMITGAEGGHVVLDPPEKPRRILIMDTEDINTAQKVLQLNIAGIGGSNTGKDGPYGVAMTLDGQVNAGKLYGETVESLTVKTNNLIANGGYINIEADDDKISVITLRYGDEIVSVSAGETCVYSGPNNYTRMASNGMYIVKDGSQVATINDTAGYSGKINGQDGANGSFIAQTGERIDVMNGIITSITA